MRTSIVTALATAAATVLGTVGVLAAPHAAAADDLADAPSLTASQSLVTARRVLDGEARTADPSATVALRDLWMSRQDLDAEDRRVAEAILARPSDGSQDPFGFGYPDPSIAEKTCNDHLCVHYVPSGDDAPRSAAWVGRTLEVLDDTWTHHVDRLGFRPPLPDGTRGGSRHFDVYLKDLGGELYGYCATENERRARTASGFCVLDNTFSRAKFRRGTPEGNLRVTAAHELFHAVQYAYDYAEDPWMMESTATWVEERVASEINDNRQFLREGQLYLPSLPLDLFVQGRGHQYGNWIFWEYLSQRYGTSLVRKTWERAGSRAFDGRRHSFQALHDVLAERGGFAQVYARYAVDNTVPHLIYAEGADYRTPRPRRTVEISQASPSASLGRELKHAAAVTYRFTPHRSLRGRAWKLRLEVDGPHARTSPAARVLVHLRNGRVVRRNIRLDDSGQGRRWLMFDARRVSAVAVTLVNASTRMRCGRNTLMVCGGRAIDDDLPFRVTAQLRR